MMSGSFLTLSHGSAFFDVDSILSEGFLKDGKITTITAPNLGPILLSKRKKSVKELLSSLCSHMSGLSSDWPSSGHMTISEPITMVKGMGNATVGIPYPSPEPVLESALPESYGPHMRRSGSPRKTEVSLLEQREWVLDKQTKWTSYREIANQRARPRKVSWSV